MIRNEIPFYAGESSLLKAFIFNLEVNVLGFLNICLALNQNGMYYKNSERVFVSEGGLLWKLGS